MVGAHFSGAAKFYSG